jgi:membrane protein
VDSVPQQDRPRESEEARSSPLKVAWRAFSNFRAHQMPDHAAALTYYAMMSLFPGLLVGVALLGLLGEASLATEAADYVAEHGADPTTAETVRQLMRNLLEASGGAVSAALIVSLVLAINGASGAFGAAGRALNVVYGQGEDRSWLRRKLSDFATTLVVILLFAIVLVAIFLGGGIADDLFGTIGLGSTAASIWSIARWPVALLAALVGYALVYEFAPDTKPRRFRFITPGAAVGVAIWILGSIGFAIYIRNFSKYGAAYGAFGAAIVLLLWLWLSALAFLYGAELNAELEREHRAREESAPRNTSTARADRDTSGTATDGAPG